MEMKGKRYSVGQEHRKLLFRTDGRCVIDLDNEIVHWEGKYLVGSNMTIKAAVL